MREVVWILVEGSGIALGTIALLSLTRALIHRTILAGDPSREICRLFERLEHKDEYGKLYSAPSRYGRIQWVDVYDYHAKEAHCIPVPRWIMRAKQGVAWSYGTTEELYNPIRV